MGASSRASIEGVNAAARGAPARAESSGFDPGALQGRIGYAFARAELLGQALLHASAAKRGDRGNERLEFLGDRVLGLVIAEALLDRFPAEREGSIARRHASLVSQPVLARVAETLLARFPAEREGSIARRHANLVSEPVLARVAAAIGLGDYLTFAKGDRDAGAAKNPAILADGLEAMIAAIYLDGGLEPARAFVLTHWQPLVADDSAPPSDPKTALQEWALARGLPLPTYRVVKAEGPPHSPRFEVTVTIEGVAPAAGEGRSKRVAEKNAAGALMAILLTQPAASPKRARRRG